MELSNFQPRTSVRSIIEATSVKDVSPIDRRSVLARSYRHTSFSLSDNSSEYSDATTSTTPLYQESGSSFSNQSLGESDCYYNASAIYFSSKECRIPRIQKRALPPIPKDEQLLGNSLPGFSSTYCYSLDEPEEATSEKRSPLMKRRSLMMLTFFAVLMSIISVGITVTIFVKRVIPEWESGTIYEGEFQACVACAELPDDDDGGSADLKGQLTKKLTGNETLCCATTSGQLSDLIQLIIKQKASVPVTSEAKQMPRFSPVSAHKYLHPWAQDQVKEPTFSSKKRYHLKLSQYEETSSEHVRHVTAKNNSLQIQFSGWYFVYSGVIFRPATGKPCSSFRHQTWGHFINRHSPNRRSTSGILVQTAHTCCDNCTDEHHTSYAGGVFLLESGDDIFVDVTGAGLVKYDGEGSYIGLVMLGSWDPAT